MRRSLTYYWRTHLAVALGAAVACAVLTGALLVGDSVRGSLRDLTLDRLGEIDRVLVGERPFREALADDLEAALPGSEVAPLLMLRGSAVHAETESRASQIGILGVDERFAALYPEAGGLDFSRRSGQLFPSVYLSDALADELGVAVGDPVVLSYERPSDIPRETLVGRQQATGSVDSLRLSVVGVVPERGLGGFGLAAQQARSFNAVVEMRRLQRSLFGRGVEGRANLLAIDTDADENAVAAALAGSYTVSDLGIRLLAGADHVAIQSSQFVLSDRLVAALESQAVDLGLASQPVLTYLANSIASIENGSRSIPYSTLSALDPPTDAALGSFELLDGSPAPALEDNAILLNEWAAEDLGAGPGDLLEVSYYELGPRDELATVSHTFRLAGVVEMAGLAADRDLTPEFPGMSDAEDIVAWDPPFPVDLDRVRARDEEYWDQHRATPKAFVSQSLGRQLWRSRFGQVTSLRLAAAGATGTELEARLASELPRALDPGVAGLSLRALRADGLRAARGATDFAQLFLALSMFLIAAAALLVGLLFRLGVEQRAREVGLLRAVGFRESSVRRGLLVEGGLLSAVGALAGLAGAVLYAWLLLAGLRSWWLPAVGTPVLSLHVRPASLFIGWIAAVLVVLLVIAWTLRRLRRVATPSLLAGSVAGGGERQASRRPKLLAWAFGLLAALLLVSALATGQASSAAYAVPIGSAMLIAGLALFAHWCGGAGRGRANALSGAALLGMGARNSARNRGRSILSVALVASAAFTMVVVAANRDPGEDSVVERDSGAGGFTLVAEADVPIHPDLNDPERRLELGFSEEASEALEGVSIVPFRLLPGEDVSCLNLYRPERPRLLGVPPELVNRGGFAFQNASTETDEPWSLLDEELEDGAIPAIGDYNSVLWILHSGLGKELVMENEAGEEIRLRFVALLSKSLFQSEVLISEEQFERHFPTRTGYSYFLADPPPERAAEVAGSLEAVLGRFGMDATGSAEKLAAYHAVANTYLSTFQTLGGLGLILGTVGLGIVLLRNVLERKAELATLRAFGFRRVTLAWMVVAENAVLLVTGILVGTVAGLVAAMPNLLAIDARVPWASVAFILVAIFAIGMLSSALAVAGTLRVPLLPALKAD